MGFEIFGATARESWRLGGRVSGRTSSISNACQEGSESRLGVGYCDTCDRKRKSWISSSRSAATSCEVRVGTKSSSTF